MSALAIATICCSPPDIWLTTWSRRSPSRGKKSNISESLRLACSSLFWKVSANKEILGHRHARKEHAAFRNQSNAGLYYLFSRKLVEPATLELDRTSDVRGLTPVHHSDD